MKKFKVLAIDGGGIRGIVPCIILWELEKQIKNITGKESHISEYFDLVSGNSTGGIIACGLLTPDSKGKPKFKAKDMLELYLQDGKKIFERKFLYRIRSKFGLGNAKFSKKNIEEVLKKAFRDVTLKDMLKPILIPSYSLEDANPFFFSNRRIVENINNFYIKDVARATSAAPTFFEPAFVKSLDGFGKAFIDGGMFANNPSICAYTEARKLITGGANDMIFVSLGTGGVRESYPYKSAKDWGLIGWTLPVLKILLSANQDIVHHQMEKIFKTKKVNDEDNYFRIDEIVPHIHKSMDDISDDNLKGLIEFGEFTVKNNIEQIKKIASLLVNN